MSTDTTQNGEATNATGVQLPTMAEQGQMLGLAWLNDYQQKLACQRLAYANACGVPVGPGSGAGISLTTNNYPGQQASVPQPVAPPAAPASSGISGLAKAGILAATLAGGGVVGAAVNTLLNPQQPAAATAPGQVTIGISPDGTLINPNAQGGQ